MSQDQDYFYPGRLEEEQDAQRQASGGGGGGGDEAGTGEGLWWEKKEPLVIRSFIVNFLKNENGELKDDIDLEVHGQESRQTITNATVQEVTEMNPRLKGLTINNCTGVTDIGLWSIARNCTAIRALRMKNCFQISLIGLRAISLRCSSIEELDLSECSAINDLSLRVIAAGCWGLKTMNLAGCNSVSDAGVAELAACCKQLKRMNLSRCERLGEFGDTALIALGKYCQDLEELDLFGCKHVKDAGLKAIGQCHNLEVLRLTNCNEVSSDAVRSLAKVGTKCMLIFLPIVKFISFYSVHFLPFSLAFVVHSFLVALFFARAAQPCAICHCRDA
jgi:F-box/leucine-rich repeat protein 2/20